MNILVSIIGVIAMLCGSILAGGKFIIFLDLPSLMIVFGFILFSLIGKLGFKFYKSKKNEICNVVCVSSLFGGAIGTIVMMIQTLQYHTNVLEIGPAIAVSFLSSYYGVCISLVAYILKDRSY